MPSITSRGYVRIPKGICDDWRKKIVFFGVTEESSKVCMSESLSGLKDAGFYVFCQSRIDSNGQIRLSEDAMSILAVDIGDNVVFYKKENNVFLFKPQATPSRR